MRWVWLAIGPWLIGLSASAAQAWPAATPPADALSVFRAMAGAVAGGARAALEQRLSGALGRPVHIERVDAGVAGLTLVGVSAEAGARGPAARVREIELASPTAPVARFRDLQTTATVGGRAAPVTVREGTYAFSARALDASGGHADLPGSPFDFSGHVESTGQGRSRFSLHVRDLTTRDARIAVDLEGTIARGLDSVDAEGEIHVEDLQVDLSRSRSVERLRAQVAGASASARALDDLARGGRFSRVTGQLKAQTDFYGPVFEEVSHAHRLARVSGPIRVHDGTLTAARLVGPDLLARATVRFPAKQLDAHVDRLQLGRVTVLDLAIAGPLQSPSVTFDRKNIRLDGQPAPVSEAVEAAAAILGARDEQLSGGAALRILDALLRAGQETPASPAPHYRNNLERLLRESEQ